MGPTMSGPKSMGHSQMDLWGAHLWHGSSSNGWGHVSWVITFAPGSYFVGSSERGHPCDDGSPILRRLEHAQNSSSLEASVAPQGGSRLVIIELCLGAEKVLQRSCNLLKIC